MWIGIFLICMGILFVLSNVGIIEGDVWDYLLSIFLILLGASIILKRVKKDKRTEISGENPK